MHLYLIRHGQSVENTQPWDGRNDNSPLTPLGEQQAAQVGAWIAEHLPLDRLYASTLQRTRQTAQSIHKATDMDVHFEDRLREVGTARPDGTPFEDDKLPRYFADRWGSLYPYKEITEGGENWMHFRARIGGFVEWLIDELSAEHENTRVGVVCHGGVIEGVFEHVFQKGPVSAVVVHTYNTGITHLEYRPLQGRPDWILYYHNRVEHLTPEQLT